MRARPKIGVVLVDKPSAAAVGTSGPVKTGVVVEGVLFRSGDTAQPNIVQLDSGGDGNETGSRGWTPSRDPSPQTPLWGLFRAPFSRKHEEIRGFQVQTENCFIPLYLRE